ncbi:hypothetical protein [Deinococcus aquatilis]|uniref:hypothetical protein n=1 Tax=Deinococcus aquatilis TaxID=519440 RepID=UPI0003A11F57|nr:hypothetical protein [Deinococcus aquatilis]
MDSSSPNWGGPRKGAGRKPSPDLRGSLQLSRAVWAMIEAHAHRLSVTPQAHAAAVLQQHATAPLFATR